MVQRAIPYYCEFILENLIKPLRKHIEAVSKQKRVKAYLTFLHATEEKWKKKIEQIEQLTYNQTLLYTGKSFIEKNTDSASIVKNYKVPVKGETFKETLDLFFSGKTIAEIATIRSYTTGTIEGHLAKYVELGELDVHQIISTEKIEAIAKVVAEVGDEALNPIKTVLGEEYSYGEIRMVVSYLKSKNISK